MKSIVKTATAIVLRQVFVAVMNVLICVAFLMFATLLFTEAEGYYALVTKPGESEKIAEYNYSFSQGEDTKKAQYEKDGYVVTTVKTRNEMSRREETIFYLFTQLFLIVNVTAFIYPYLWRMASEDSNLVKFGHRNEDKLKGLKVGLLADIPLVIIFAAVFILGLKTIKVASLSIIFSSFYGLFNIIGSGAVYLSDLKAWQVLLMAVCFLLVPAISHISYTLGYKNISIGEKLVYKKKEQGE